MISLLAIFLAAGPVTVEARIPAGTVIEEAHVRGNPDDVEHLLGREARRTLYPGRTVSFADTKVADLVERNSMVRIVASKGTLRIELRGRALGEGAAGDEIRVMNLESKRTILAKIIGENLVEVPL